LDYKVITRIQRQDVNSPPDGCPFAALGRTVYLLRKEQYLRNQQVFNNDWLV
jgi:hypothetical protein